MMTKNGLEHYFLIEDHVRQEFVREVRIPAGTRIVPSAGDDKVVSFCIYQEDYPEDTDGYYTTHPSNIRVVPMELVFFDDNVYLVKSSDLVDVINVWKACADFEASLQSVGVRVHSQVFNLEDVYNGGVEYRLEALRKREFRMSEPNRGWRD